MTQVRGRITPNIFAFVGLISAGLTAFSILHWWSAIFLVVSLFFGGVFSGDLVDQTLLNGFNATVDSVLNRISEVLWAIAFYRLGAPVAWVFAFAALAAFQEYAKARLVVDQLQNVRLVTLADRPVRAIFLLVAILAYQITASSSWVTSLAIGLTVMQATSFILFARFAYKELR